MNTVKDIKLDNKNRSHKIIIKEVKTVDRRDRKGKPCHPNIGGREKKNEKEQSIVISQELLTVSAMFGLLVFNNPLGGVTPVNHKW